MVPFFIKNIYKGQEHLVLLTKVIDVMKGRCRTSIKLDLIGLSSPLGFHWLLAHHCNFISFISAHAEPSGH